VHPALCVHQVWAKGITPVHMWLHTPLYHVHQSSREGVCQACGMTVANITEHIHEVGLLLLPSIPFVYAAPSALDL